MRYEIDREEEMEKHAEVEMERELVGWNKTHILEDIQRSFKQDVLEDIRKSLRDDGIGFDDRIETEESYRIKCENLAETLMF